MEQGWKVMEAIEEILNTNETLARASVGMLINMICAKYGGDPVEFAEDIATVVKQVNEDLGEIKA